MRWCRSVKLTVELESGISFSIPVVPVHLQDVFAISSGQKREKIANFWLGVVLQVARNDRNKKPDARFEFYGQFYGDELKYRPLQAGNYQFSPFLLPWRNGTNIP